MFTHIVLKKIMTYLSHHIFAGNLMTEILS
jgi:hypothetical protein